MLRVEPIELGAGHSLAIRGVSGSGKSTLLGLLSGELLPDSGTVAFNGINLSTQSSAQRSDFRIRNTGLVFQGFGLVESLSVVENVFFPFDCTHHAHFTATQEIVRTHWLAQWDSTRSRRVFPRNSRTANGNASRSHAHLSLARNSSSPMSHRKS